MTQGVVRLAWATVVVAAGLALLRGLVLTTHFSLTPQAQADAEAGRAWLWVATVTLLVAALAAFSRWQVGPITLVPLVVAGPVGLTAEALGWIPLVAVPVSGSLLLVGLTGGLLAPPRANVSSEQRATQSHTHHERSGG